MARHAEAKVPEFRPDELATLLYGLSHLACTEMTVYYAAVRQLIRVLEEPGHPWAEKRYMNHKILNSVVFSCMRVGYTPWTLVDFAESKGMRVISPAMVEQQLLAGQAQAQGQAGPQPASKPSGPRPSSAPAESQAGSRAESARGASSSGAAHHTSTSASAHHQPPAANHHHHQHQQAWQQQQQHASESRSLRHAPGLSAPPPPQTSAQHTDLAAAGAGSPRRQERPTLHVLTSLDTQGQGRANGVARHPPAVSVAGEQ